jgi:DNA-binding MarR family transcriptional regulator
MNSRHGTARAAHTSGGGAKEGAPRRPSVRIQRRPLGAIGPSPAPDADVLARQDRPSERPAGVRDADGRSRDSVGPEGALDDLLARLAGRELSPTEVRVLLWLSEREATPSELTDALRLPPGAITRVGRRLAMQGLIRRRFERGRQSHFAFSITSSGLLALRPLMEWVAVTGALGSDGLA